MAPLLKHVQSRVQSKPMVKLPYNETFRYVRRGYGSGTWTWIVVMVLVIGSGLYFLTTHDFSTLAVLGMSFSLYAGLFIPLYFLRASDAMLLGQISATHIARCIEFLEQQNYNQKQLRKIKLMAEADKNNMPSNIALTNVFWPIVIALGATAYQYKDVPIPAWLFVTAFVFATIPLLSFLIQTERANADLVIIQAVTELEDIVP